MEFAPGWPAAEVVSTPETVGAGPRKTAKTPSPSLKNKTKRYDKRKSLARDRGQFDVKKKKSRTSNTTAHVCVSPALCWGFWSAVANKRCSRNLLELSCKNTAN